MRSWLIGAAGALLLAGGVCAAMRSDERPTSIPAAELLALPLPADEHFDPLLLIWGGAPERRNWVDPFTSERVSAFDLATLGELPQQEIATTTDWTDGERRFRGVLLRDLLAAVGAHGALARAGSRTDYVVDIPMSDVLRYDMLIASHMDGEALQPRNTGPLWLIYPRDDHRELRDPLYNSRWVSNLTELKVE